METRIAMIREAAAYANKEYMERCWVLDEKDNKKKWLWEKYDTPQVIVCAANRYKDFIVTGSRHYSVPMQMTIGLVGLDALYEYCKAFDDEVEDDKAGRQQGFIDQYGTFHNRKEAMRLCLEQGRPLKEEGGYIGLGYDLFSEHLY